MEQQEKQQIQAVVHKMLGAMVQKKGSDLFLTAGFPPAICHPASRWTKNVNPANRSSSAMARKVITTDSVEIAASTGEASS